MAQLTANCTCSKCGKRFKKDFFDSGRGAYSRLNDKVEWAESGGIDTCPDCYKAEMRKKEMEQGLLCTLILDCIAEERGEPSVYLVFDGDSYSYKDTLKANGCWYTDNYPSCSGPFGFFDRVPKKWVFRCREIKEAEAAAEKIGINFDNVKMPTETDAMMWADAQKRYNEKKAQYEAELAELGAIPAWSDTIKALTDGKYWNGKVYWGKNTTAIYLDDEKVKISKTDANEIERIQAARTAWKEKRDEIERKYHTYR